MSPEKIISIIEMYETRLKEASIPKVRIDPSRQFSSLETQEILAHAHYLCEGVKAFAADPGKQYKANRHLTAVQMCLSFAGWYTLNELMEHNRATSD